MSAKGIRTKFNGILDNDNLEVYNAAVLDMWEDSSPVLIIVWGDGFGSAKGSAKSINNQSVDFENVNSFNSGSIPEGTKVRVYNKYEITAITGNGADFSVSLLKYCPLENVGMISGSLRGNIEELLYSSTNVLYFTPRNNDLLTGNIENVANKMANLIKFNVSYTGISGHLDSLVNSPLTEVNIIGSNMVTTQATITALQNKGCTVYYLPEQVVD